MNNTPIQVVDGRLMVFSDAELGVNVFDQPQYRTHVGMWFKDTNGVLVEVLQLVDTSDNRAIGHIVTHDKVIVDSLIPPKYETVLHRWITQVLGYGSIVLCV